MIELPATFIITEVTRPSASANRLHQNKLKVSNNICLTSVSLTSLVSVLLKKRAPSASVASLTVPSVSLTFFLNLI